MSLSSAQRSAIERVAAHASSRRAEAVALLDQIGRMCDLPPSELHDALANIQQHARVALHFHPDRPDRTQHTVAQRLLADGHYRSQFETGISNGGLSAHRGGQRDLCEQALFDGAYQAAGSSSAERPKYGSLGILRHADGPSPRFGSCYLVLAAEVSQRCTFSYLDSHEGAIERGTHDAFDDVFAALLQSAFNHEIALGESGLTVPSLVRRIRGELPLILADVASFPVARNLNHYIEAQVHGDVLLGRDVEALVADPSFRDTETGRVLSDLCQRYAVALHWHPGFWLSYREVPRHFRGPAMPSLAERVARAGIVDASAIGAAARDLRANPGAWSDRGGPDDILQELKFLWHVLVKYGKRGADPVERELRPLPRSADMKPA